MVKPWANAGCICYCVDAQHSIRRDRIESVGAGEIRYVWGDIRSWRLPSDAKPIIGFAFTPCTDLTVSCARDFKKKAGWLLADGVQLFDSAEVAFSFGGFPYMLENPVGRLNTHRRRPDFSFHPWEYAGYLDDIQIENTSKRTCGWIGGGFVIPPKKEAPPPHREDCFFATPSDDRADERSKTPLGFALAVFESNKHLIK